MPSEQEEEVLIDIESIDFFSNRTYLDALLAREQNRCFYCLRDVSRDTCTLDHVSPRVDGIDNSYRNIVIACCDCNARKQETNGQDFLRSLYRRNLLSEAEFQDRITALDALQEGRLVPKV